MFINPLHQTLTTILSISLLGISACANNPINQRQAIDLSNPGRIELQITANDPALAVANIAQEVSQNLAGWDYPVGNKAGETFSHNLKVTVDKVEYGDTPTGFSFSSGNSDPRAMGFQKTFVLPITCRLSAIARPEQSSELKMGFAENRANKLFLGADKLADHISTVCFNVLSEVKWPKKTAEYAGSTTVKSPGWMPEIRIETKEIPAASIEQVPMADKVKISPSNPGAVDGDTAKTSIETKTIPPNTEHRKQIIIYNQGSPVILELGHERR